MAFRQGNRNQQTFLPLAIDQYISADDPVRAYDAFVDHLNLNELGFNTNDRQVGNASYDPRSMLKLLIYGYAYGWRSSRKLERATHHNLSFKWLLGGLIPDHKTIAEFRRRHKKGLAQVLKSCARLCMELNLIAGNTLFLDGSKIRGNASIDHSWNKKRCQQKLKNIDQRIAAILEECEKADQNEADSTSQVKMSKELADQESLKSKVKSILTTIEEENRQQVNTTDQDAVRIHSRQGNHAGYNAQCVVDNQNGMIVNTDVVSESSDIKQFANQIDQANEVLGNSCKVACSDAGYNDYGELKKIVAQKIKVVIPSQQQANHSSLSPFDKANFKYNQKKNYYLCPCKKRLMHIGFDVQKRAHSYRIENPNDCLQCIYFGQCTKSLKGRVLKRYANEEVRNHLVKQYNTKASQRIYSQRKEKAERPFGHIKRNMNVQSFLLRGRAGVNAEMAILATCFNLSRMMKLLGINKTLKKLKKITTSSNLNPCINTRHIFCCQRA